MALDWAHYIGDRRETLAALLRRTLGEGSLVFCCGGIGATPDDVTRHAAADASGRPIVRHPEGEAILVERFSDHATPERMRLIEFPQGVELIPNPVNRIPGFRMNHHHFLPGFPDMAWPMIEWILDHHYAGLARAPEVSHSIRVHARESDLVPLLERLGGAHPDVRFSSLPDMHGKDYTVELGVHGLAERAAQGFAALQAGLDAEGVRRADE